METQTPFAAQRAQNVIVLRESELEDYYLSFSDGVVFHIKGSEYALNYTGCAQMLAFPAFKEAAELYLRHDFDAIRNIENFIRYHPGLTRLQMRKIIPDFANSLAQLLKGGPSIKAITNAYWLERTLLLGREDYSYHTWLTDKFAKRYQYLPWSLERRLKNDFILELDVKQQGGQRERTTDFRARVASESKARAKRDIAIRDATIERYAGRITPRESRDKIQLAHAVYKQEVAAYVDKSVRLKSRRKVELQSGRKIGLGVGLTALTFAVTRALKRLSNTTKTITDVVTQAQRVIGVIQKVLKGMEEITNPVREVFNTLLQKVPGDGWCKALLVLLVCNHFSQLGGKITSAVLLVIVGGRLSKHTFNLIAEFFCGGDLCAVEQQSSYSTIQSVVAAIVAHSVFKSCSREKGTAFLLKNMATIPTAVKGFDALFDVFLKIVEGVVNAIRKVMSLEEMTLDPRIERENKKRVERAYRFLNSGLAKDGKQTTDARIREGKLIYMDLTRAISDSLSKDNISQLSQVAERVRKEVEVLQALAGIGSGYRSQPVCLMLSGMPGVGKTLTVQQGSVLIAELAGFLPKDCTVENATNMIYSRPLGSPYYDGYNSQPILLIDDLAMQKMEPGEDRSGVFEVMNHIGPYRTFLNMARCELKGMCPFDSKLVFLTTNMKSMEEINASSVMLEPAAFKRRLDFHYELAVRPEFRKHGSHMLDVDLFTRELQACQEGEGGFTERFPWYIWEVYPRELGVVDAHYEPGTGMPYLDLLRLVAEKICTREKQYDMLVNAIGDQLKHRAVPQSGEEIPYDEESGVDNVHSYVSREGSQFGGITRLADEEFNHDDFEDKTSKSSLDATMRKLLNMPPISANQSGFKTAGQAAFKAFQVATRFYLELLALEMVIKFTLGLVGAVFTKCWQFLKGVFSKIFGARVEEQSNFKNTGKQKKIIPAKQVVQQSGAQNSLCNMVYDNTYKVTVDMGDSLYVLGQVLFLVEDKFIMPLHFVEDMEKLLAEQKINHSSLVSFHHANIVDGDGKKYKAVMSVREFMSFVRKRIPERDLCFCAANKHLKMRRNISKKFLTESQLDSASGLPTRLDVFSIETASDVESPKRIVYTEPRVRISRSGQTISIGSCKHKRFAEYFAETQFGDCGAPLTLQDPSRFNSSLILGLHVGAKVNMRMGYATLVSQELVDELLSGYKIVEELSFEDTLKQSGSSYLKDISSFEVEATTGVDDTTEPILNVSHGVSAPVRSKLVGTHFKEEDVFGDVLKNYYGEEPTPIVPMKLGNYYVDGTLVSPMSEAVKPYAGDLFFPDTSGFDESVRQAMKPFFTATAKVHAKVLSIEEAIRGKVEIGLKGIPRATSMGYPMCLAFSSKKDVLGYDDYDLTTPAAVDLIAQVENLQKSLEEGKRPFFIARGFLKDETRKVGKNARYIAGTDLRYYILNRMYFGHFVAALASNTLESGICIGLNQYKQWDDLKRKFNAISDNVWDGDFTAFDSQQQPGCLWSLCEEINRWYEQRGGTVAESEIRRILFMDLVNSRHLYSPSGVATTVHQWQRSLPSGHFLTSTVNSMLSMSLLVDAFRATTGRDGEFWHHCFATTLGDDNLCAASDEVIDQFNQITMAEHMWNRFRYTYTAGRKGEELKKCMSLGDTTFLQRRFTEKTFTDNGVVRTVTCCPIRPESFLTSMYYIKESKDVRYYKEVLCNSIENALDELAMHSDEMWNKVAPILVREKERFGESVDLPTSDCSFYLKRVLERVPVWL